jgi:hypothetical protein
MTAQQTIGAILVLETRRVPPPLRRRAIVQRPWLIR